MLNDVPEQVPVEVAALGYEDFMTLRRERAEINDAVLPYIAQTIKLRVSRADYFYIEMTGAVNLPTTTNLTGTDGETTNP
jgi:hypothetical protein